MSEQNAIIEIDNLAKAYGYLPVLKKVSLRVERGQFVALLGANGSGKSTLMRLLCGLSKPTVGDIRVGGWQIPQEAEAVRAQIGMVSHKSLLYDNLTANENLHFFARLYRINDPESRIKELLARVGLSRRTHSLVRTFSRGMQQRLSIARALLHAPHVLLLDEPFTGLDQDAALVLDELLIEAHEDGHTLLMTTHQLARAAKLATRIVILNKGTIAYDENRRHKVNELAQIYTQATGAVTSR